MKACILVWTKGNSARKVARGLHGEDASVACGEVTVAFGTFGEADATALVEVDDLRELEALGEEIRKRPDVRRVEILPEMVMPA